MLLCYYVTMLLCYYVTMLLCYYVTMLLIILRYYIIVLQVTKYRGIRLWQ